MRKILFGIFAFVMAITLIAVITPAQAKQSTDTCQEIKDGTIKDVNGNIIDLGYDQWGYNYQAHMFNGYYDNYSRPEAPVASGDRLMMKWNNAWLSNKDCGTQNGQANYTQLNTPDTVLDRHYPTDSYRGSGAWLTNHASGEYTSTEQFSWDVTGNYTFYIHHASKDFFYEVALTQNGSDITGTLTDTYLPAQYVNKVLPLTGTISGDSVTLNVVYPDDPWGTRTFTGTIADPAGTLSGDWSDSGSGLTTGTWSTTVGTAQKVYDTCTWSDFIKIVAVPETAEFVPDSNNFYGEGMWYTDDTHTTEIGPSIWGSFAVIQEVSSDPCGEKADDITNYRSQVRSGLGNW